jgi:hypothetical protein
MNQVVNAPSHAVILSTGANNTLYQNKISNEIQNNKNANLGF